VLPPHYKLIPYPKAIWVDSGNYWKSNFDENVLKNIRKSLNNTNKPVSDKTLNILNYRPDLLKRIGPHCLNNKSINDFIVTHPRPAVTLLKCFYEETSHEIEHSISNSGENIIELISWAKLNHRSLKNTESFYRTGLVIDSYWGYHLGTETNNLDLISEIKEWSADERYTRSSAAALFLELNKDEPTHPYRELILQNQFYTYLSLSRFAQSGYPVDPVELNLSPKWAAHFALSPDCKNQSACKTIAAQDSAWLIEIAHNNHSLLESDYRTRFIDEIRSMQCHPYLDEAIDGYLETLENPLPTIFPAKPNAPGMLQALTDGREAEERILKDLNLGKNKIIWRPTQEQIESPLFKKIVGVCQYTKQGIHKGTVLDSTDGGYTEIKSGSSMIYPTRQIRLQTFKATIDEKTLTIYTDRPISDELKRWSKTYGVKLMPLPKQLPLLSI